MLIKVAFGVVTSIKPYSCFVTFDLWSPMSSAFNFVQCRKNRGVSNKYDYTACK